jgi:hypothetical protein
MTELLREQGYRVRWTWYAGVCGVYATRTSEYQPGSSIYFDLGLERTKKSAPS